MTVSQNASGTSKPYNSADALSNTNPTLSPEPQPPAPAQSHGGCGVVGDVIAKIVSVVVEALVDVVSHDPNLGAAAGNAAYQATEIVVGNQKKFNWNEVAAAYVASYIDQQAKLPTGSNSLASAQQAANPLQAAIQAGEKSVIQQSTNMAYGVQKTFSWTDVAVASAEGGATKATADWANANANADVNINGLNTPNVPGGANGQLGGVLTGAADALAGAATESALTGQSLGKSLRDTLPSAIGNTIGNMIAGSIENQSKPPQLPSNYMPSQWSAATDVTSQYSDLMTEGFSNVGGTTQVTDSDGGSEVYAGACFVAGTMVHTEKGLRAIETITAGDMVASRDQKNTDTLVRWRKVKQRHVHTDRMVIRLMVDHAGGQREDITTTSEHPFFVDSLRWVPAADLRVGDRFDLINGAQSVLIAVERVSGLRTVHNLTVDQDHTYFVGEAGVWVHNLYGDDSYKNKAGETVQTHPDPVTGQLHPQGTGIIPWNFLPEAADSGTATLSVDDDGKYYWQYSANGAPKTMGVPGDSSFTYTDNNGNAAQFGASTPSPSPQVSQADAIGTETQDYTVAPPNGASSGTLESDGAWTFGQKLSDGSWRLAEFGTSEIAAGSQVMQSLGDYGERQLVTNTLNKFNLDSSSVADVQAARAYIWTGTVSDNPFSPVNFTGDGTLWQREAGQEAVMRMELANPGVTYHANLAIQGSTQTVDQNALRLLSYASSQAIQDAGIARHDPAFKTIAIPDDDGGGTVLVARPAGAPSYLQANSRIARAAVAANLMQGNWSGHHLVPVASYWTLPAWAKAAYSAGWQPNGPSNVIALPADAQAQAMVGGLLPIHNGPHPDYNLQTQAQLNTLIRISGTVTPTPLLARGIFETVQYENRLQILTGQWNPQVK